MCWPTTRWERTSGSRTDRTMSDLRAFIGPNAGYVLELYDRYLADPESVDADSRAFFEAFSPPSSVETTPAATAATAPAAGVDLSKVVAAVALATGIREYGHLAVPLDPLGSDPPGATELDPATYGITEEDLKAIPAEVVGGKVASGAANAAEAIERLRNRYTTR